jgi:hypothetical protein
VLVDEIHNLNHGTPAGEDLPDHLKYFTEHLPATFIYAGIDVERCGVFTGTRGRQLAGRIAAVLAAVTTGLLASAATIPAAFARRKAAQLCSTKSRSRT